MASGGDSLVPRLAAFISDFIAQLSSHRVGSLAQIWLPETAPDGSVELYTQGLPYSINGVGDLLALFRCISCKYKFATDPGKALQMGAVGRVFTSGEPEMSHNVQRYDQHVYLRAAEAQRCRVHSTLFMPLYATARRDTCLGVFEVVLTDPEPNFAGMVGWIISCLSSEGLFTAEVDTASLANQGLGMSLLGGTADRDGVSALESGAQLRGAAANGRVATERGSGVPAGAAGGAATAHSGGGGPAGRDELADLKQGAALPQAGRSPTGAASPPPQQEQKQGGEGGSGSGGGSGQPPSQPQLLSGSGQQQQQHLLSQLGSGPLGSAGSLLAGLMQGSVHHSGADLPSGGPTQDAAAAVAAVPPAAVAAALQQVLQQGGSGMLQQQQLAALLGGQGLPPVQLPGSATPTMLNGLGTSPPLAAGTLQQQDAQPSPPGTQQQQQQGEGATGGAGLPQNGSLADMATAAQQAADEDDMDDDTEEDQPFLRPAPGAAQKYGQGNRILTYDDLAAQFGYGLKEAAARLNICPTTLKRACRRLGVPRWPRREIARHKKAKQSVKPDGKGDGSKGEGAGGASQQQQQQQQQGGGGGPGSGPGSGALKGLSSGSGGSGPQQQKQQQQQQGAAQLAPLLAGGPPGSQLVRPASSSLLTGLTGLEQLLPIQPQLGPPAPGGGLPPELAAALASTLTQQAMQQGGGPLGGLPPQLVGPVMQLLQQNQAMGALAAPPQPPLAWQAPAPQAAPGLPPGLAGLPPLLPIPRGGLPQAGAAHRQRSPPPAPSLSNLGLPMRADSKLHSAGPVGSLDILAHADLEMSVGNGLSLGNGSPRLALSNLGGLSQLGLSGFDFGASLLGGAAPAATATGGAGGATGPQNGPAHSSGAVSKPREKH